MFHNVFKYFFFFRVHEGGWSSIEVMLSHSTPPSPTYMYTVYKSRDNEWLQLLHNAQPPWTRDVYAFPKQIDEMFDDFSSFCSRRPL